MQRDLPPQPDALKKGHCVPCERGTAPLTETEETNYHDATPLWELQRDTVHQLTREFAFKNFSGAVKFINSVAEIAEAEGHHPDIYLHNYKNVRVDLSTHAIHGLSTNDFILAAKIDELV